MLLHNLRAGWAAIHLHRLLLRSCAVPPALWLCCRAAAMPHVAASRACALPAPLPHSTSCSPHPSPACNPASQAPRPGRQCGGRLQRREWGGPRQLCGQGEAGHQAGLRWCGLKGVRCSRCGNCSVRHGSTPRGMGFVRVPACCARCCAPLLHPFCSHHWASPICCLEPQCLPLCTLPILTGCSGAMAPRFRESLLARVPTAARWASTGTM